FSSTALYASNRKTFSLAAGFIVDDMPLGVATTKILLLECSWSRRLFSCCRQAFSGGINGGFITFYLLPIPDISFYLKFLPPEGLQLYFHSGVFYDMLYGGLFGMDIRFALEVRETFQFQLLVLPTPVPPYHIYPETVKAFFQPLRRFKKGEDFFPGILFGIMLAYKFNIKGDKNEE
ncbi:MAG TPA: hypothetical protein VKS21_03465, partial [Spirochaetota bacterium]|nr:hypothetical protein [Spirochaetota bacterium]